jgi:hypothetical protein
VYTGFVLALIGAGPSALIGCATAGDALLPDPVEGAPAMTEPMLVDVTSQAGDVTIIGDANLEFPEVRTLPERMTSRATRSAQITRTRDGRVLRVVVVTGRGEGVLRPGFVPEQPAEVNDVVIRVPRLAGVRVRSGSGDVLVEGVAGSVDIQAGVGQEARGGNVRVTVAESAGLPVNIATPRGEVRVRMPASSAGRVTLDAPAGRVTMLGRTVKSTDVSAATKLWTGTINDGLQPIVLRSAMGNVELEFVE